ncbi:hypothetical protein Hdeb2414_s0083g00781861 [Helianthus debilis subsp. tardiflorus]
MPTGPETWFVYLLCNFNVVYWCCIRGILGCDRSKRLHNQCNGMFSSWYNYCRRSETLQRHCGSIGKLYRNVKLMVLGLGLSVGCHWTTESWWHQASIFSQRKRFYFVGIFLKWDIRENGLTIVHLLLLRPVSC